MNIDSEIFVIHFTVTHWNLQTLTAVSLKVDLRSNENTSAADPARVRRSCFDRSLLFTRSRVNKLEHVVYEVKKIPFEVLKRRA